MNFLNIFYLFVLYSFFGWVIETTYVSIKQKHLVNIGFLDGPFSPIYGFGAISIVLIVFPFQNNLLLFFSISLITASILEYLTSYLFEKIFNVNWWNYSKEPFNLHGRVCLEASLYWGFLSVLLLIFIHPKVFPFATYLSNNIGQIGITVFLIYFLIDATNTFQSLLKFKKGLVLDLNFGVNLNKKITRLINSFPNLKPKN